MYKKKMKPTFIMCGKRRQPESTQARIQTKTRRQNTIKSLKLHHSPRVWDYAYYPCWKCYIIFIFEMWASRSRFAICAKVPKIRFRGLFIHCVMAFCSWSAFFIRASLLLHSNIHRKGLHKYSNLHRVYWYWKDASDVVVRGLRWRFSASILVFIPFHFFSDTA